MSDWAAHAKEQYHELGKQLSQLRLFLSDEEGSREAIGEANVAILRAHAVAMELYLETLADRLEQAEENKLEQ